MFSNIEKAFSSVSFGSLKLSNRIIRASMFEPCPGGVMDDAYIKMHENAIDGGVSMSTTGFVAICPGGRVHDNQLGMKKNSVERLKKLTDAIHDKGGKISIQLSFIGPYKFINYPDDWASWFVLRYSEEELEQVKLKFVEAAIQALESGFDAIEIHHFFLSQFIYEETNLRTDKYGGSVENRSRYPAELFRSIRDAVDDYFIQKLGDKNYIEEFPVFGKFTVSPSLPESELLFHGQRLVEESGVSSLVTFPGAVSDSCDERYSYCFRASIALQEHLKKNSSCNVGRKNLDTFTPVVYSGGISTVEDLDEALDHFEVVQMGRALLRDYEFPNKIKEGRWDEVGECLKCSICHNYMWEEEPELRCAFKKKVI